MAPYEALYIRKCRSPIGWFDVVETTLVGEELVQQAIEKVKLIQERLLAAQSRQKSYANNRDETWNFRVIRKVGQVAYELDLHSDLESVHTVFHVSMLRKCIGDPSKIVSVDDVQVTEELSYEETPTAILDRQEEEAGTVVFGEDERGRLLRFAFSSFVSLQIYLIYLYSFLRCEFLSRK
ncbi:PREDICTED: uncharacterized protein LOC109240149 [Nicotiana attenuata]|uniref:uncharacterized protein LOC109240149 n=1 Tax=Nicotiana attenuata TaxID=49451 RepID=UPI00090587FF|nr:PREDICTED: uncharacterized protein LOC109240149 [Nicotiana attenuata]